MFYMLGAGSTPEADPAARVTIVKIDIRKIAKDLGLPAAERAESQELCFVEEKNYLAFIERLSPAKAKSGPIYVPTGR